MMILTCRNIVCAGKVKDYILCRGARGVYVLVTKWIRIIDNHMAPEHWHDSPEVAD